MKIQGVMACKAIHRSTSTKMQQEVFEVLAKAKTLEELQGDRAQSPRGPQEILGRRRVSLPESWLFIAELAG